MRHFTKMENKSFGSSEMLEGRLCLLFHFCWLSILYFVMTLTHVRHLSTILLLQGASILCLLLLYLNDDTRRPSIEMFFFHATTTVWVRWLCSFHLLSHTLYTAFLSRDNASINQLAKFTVVSLDYWVLNSYHWTKAGRKPTTKRLRGHLQNASYTTIIIVISFSTYFINESIHFLRSTISGREKVLRHHLFPSIIMNMFLIALLVVAQRWLMRYVRF
jgi:hypothetical protein